MSAIRKATKGIQEAQESLKRKKERYDKKKHALEVLVLFHLLLFRKALELTAREKRLEERERTMQASEGYGGSEKPAENAGPSLVEENARLRQEVSDLRLQLELCVRSVDRDATGEKDRLRRRALELTQREQSLLQREEETDRWHEEAAELRRDAEAKAQEAERLLYSKRKELDELESSRQEVASREAALASMQQLKEEAVDQRREQVRLLEEEVSRRTYDNSDPSTMKLPRFPSFASSDVSSTNCVISPREPTLPPLLPLSRHLPSRPAGTTPSPFSSPRRTLPRNASARGMTRGRGIVFPPSTSPAPASSVAVRAASAPTKTRGNPCWRCCRWWRRLA